MPRPTRYDAPAIKRQVYLSPEASTLLDQWCAGVHGRAPGHLLDMLLRQHLGSPVVPEAKTGSLKDEGWTVSRDGDLVPPATLSNERAEARWKEEITISLAPPREHRWDTSSGSTNSLGKPCLDCGARSATPKASRPCPGASL